MTHHFIMVCAKWTDLFALNVQKRPDRLLKTAGRKETPDMLILRKEPIPETVNPRKISQGDSLMPPGNKVHTKFLDHFDVKNYEGDTYEHNCNTDDSRFDNED